MLTHAAHVNWKRSEERYERNKVKDDQRKVEEEKDPVMQSGKRMSEMNSNEWGNYFGAWQADVEVLPQ